MSSTKLNLSSLSKTRKIDSPLAKYNSTGQLFCVLCNEKVKNEIYWTGHVNGKSHKENLKHLKTQTPGSSSLKRPIAKQESTAPSSKVQKLSTPDLSEPENTLAKAEIELKRMIEDDPAKDLKQVDDKQEEEEPQQQLPEGFFDDPKEDAKARGMKFKDPQDAEWAKFVREIATEDIKSNEIVGEEQEKSAVERELDHIEEQMAQWQRVIALEKRASEYVSRNASSSSGNTAETFTNNQNKHESDSDEEEEEEDFDNSLDWRNKKR